MRPHSAHGADNNFFSSVTVCGYKASCYKGQSPIVCAALVQAVAKLGGNWNNGSNARLFNWNLNNTASDRNRNISGQLEYYLSFVTLACDPASWQNKKQQKDCVSSFVRSGDVESPVKIIQ